MPADKDTCKRLPTHIYGAVKPFELSRVLLTVKKGTASKSKARLRETHAFNPTYRRLSKVGTRQRAFVFSAPGICDRFISRSATRGSIRVNPHESPDRDGSREQFQAPVFPVGRSVFSPILLLPAFSLDLPMRYLHVSTAVPHCVLLFVFPLHLSPPVESPGALPYVRSSCAFSPSSGLFCAGS